jgi:hypothetical protein
VGGCQRVGDLAEVALAGVVGETGAIEAEHLEDAQSYVVLRLRRRIVVVKTFFLLYLGFVWGGQGAGTVGVVCGGGG